jgi:hypothetical protein
MSFRKIRIDSNTNIMVDTKNPDLKQSKFNQIHAYSPMKMEHTVFRNVGN